MTTREPHMKADAATAEAVKVAFADVRMTRTIPAAVEEHAATYPVAARQRRRWGEIGRAHV